MICFMRRSVPLHLEPFSIYNFFNPIVLYGSFKQAATIECCSPVIQKVLGDPN